MAVGAGSTTLTTAGFFAATGSPFVPWDLQRLGRGDFNVGREAKQETKAESTAGSCMSEEGSILFCLWGQSGTVKGREQYTKAPTQSSLC